MRSIYVARQPIFELGRGLVGYELLYRRDAGSDRADGESGFMSAEVIAHSLLGIGLRPLAGGAVVFVNFSDEQLRNRSWELFDRNTVVIEVLETVPCDDETLAACRALVDAGYTLALDDYVYSERTLPLLDLASIVKVDVLGKTVEELETTARIVKQHGARLLAERVETATMRDICATLGYELFQGYLFSRPETFKRTDVSPGQLAILRLLNLLQDPHTTDSALDAAFRTDLALAYKLLRIVNAAAIGGRGVTSIPHAIHLVGRETLFKWLSVLLVASLGQKGNVSHEIALTSITRARMCELVVTNAPGLALPGSAFIVGLLSLLDVLLEMPMEFILARLELADEVRDALLRDGGPLTPPLQLVEAYEHADWGIAEKMAAENRLAPETLPSLYFDALKWANERITAAHD